MATKEQVTPDAVDDGPPISVPDSEDTGEGGKLKMIVQLVRKCMGIKDIASMRLSLPASLLEPVPNLEYWHYMDRPDLFAAINDSEDSFERMLAVLRFTFSKDLKFIRGKVCKPYNSVLGEHFRAHWDVIPVSYPADPRGPPLQHLYISNPASTSSSSATRVSAETDSVKSGRSAFSYISFGRTAKSTPGTSPEPVESNIDAQISSLSLGAGATELLEADSDDKTKRIRVIYVTEQVSHHPPISSYYASCPARQTELRGVDQISAKVSGTALKVSPGSYNKGIFVNVTGGPGEGEEYHITHPVASVNGILRGNFYITVADSTIVTAKGAKDGVNYRAVIEYKEESWIGRAIFALEGVIHTYEEGETEHEEWTKAKHVPEDRIVAYFDGSWKGRIRYKLANGSTLTSSKSSPVPSAATSRSDLTMGAEDEWATLIDISTLHPVPKVVRSLEKQLSTESRKLWDPVTSRLLRKEYNEATKFKQAIEQKQRDDAAERRKKGVEFIPVYFEKDVDEGIPQLTMEGRRAVEEELSESSPYPLETALTKPA